MSKYLVRPIKGRHDYLVGSLPHRGQQIAGVMIHATRSGSSAPDHDDGPGTENWALHPDNVAAYWDELIFRKDGTRIVSLDWDTQYPRWCAGYGAGGGTWAASDYYIQIEVAQSVGSQPFSGASIDSLAESVAEKSIKYGFDIVRIPYLSQMGAPPRGICTHENSANGRKLGKSDPGPLFPWEDFLEMAHTHRTRMLGGFDMTEERVREILREEFRQQIGDGNLITAGNFLQYLSLAFSPGDPNGFADASGEPADVPPGAVRAWIAYEAEEAADDAVGLHENTTPHCDCG